MTQRRFATCCVALPRAGGFTLMEVLIALTLLSLLMLTLTSAVRGMGQTETRVETRIESMEDYRLINGLLRQLLSQVSGQTFRPMQADAGGVKAFFDGNAQALQWIGVMPARYGTGGRHYLRLATETLGGQTRWVLRYAPWNGAPAFDQWDAASVQPLSNQPLAATLQYRRPDTGQWLPVWPPAPPDAGERVQRPPVLPDAVRIDFDGPIPAWPPMFFAVRANYISDTGVGRATFGGGG